MYKVGDKFIIEIGEIFENKGKTLYRIKGFNSLVFDKNGLNKLSRYVKVEKNKNKTEELGSCKYYTDMPKTIFVNYNKLGQFNSSYTIQQGYCMGTKNCEEVNCQGKKSKCETNGYTFIPITSDSMVNYKDKE